jgi:hypothetical protein
MREAPSLQTRGTANAYKRNDRPSRNYCRALNDSKASLISQAELEVLVLSQPAVFPATSTAGKSLRPFSCLGIHGR